MTLKKGSFQTPKRKNKVVLQLELAAAKKKLHDIGMELIKESEIKEYYSDFQVFMGWEHPLDFQIEPFHIKGNERNDWATVRPPSKVGQPYILEINVTASFARSKDYKSLLFHEFTHIFDDLTLHKRVTSAGIEKPVSWYTEAHATELELMCSCAFESVSSPQKVSLSQIIPYYGSEISIADYGGRRLNDIKTHIEKENYGSAIKSLQYYFGYLRFVKQHCLIEEDKFASLMETEFINSQFGDAAIKIRDILLKPYISVIHFKQMGKLQTLLLNTLRVRLTLNRTQLESVQSNSLL